MSELPYQLSFEEREGYLFAHIKAKGISPETAKAYLTEIREKADATGATRIMILREIAELSKAGTLYFTTKDFTELLGSFRVVFVNPYAELKEQFDFANLMASNHGAEVAVLPNQPDAEKWLMR